MKLIEESYRAKQSGEYRVSTRVDNSVVFSNCKTDLIVFESTKVKTRLVLLHTLHHGTIEISVADYVCQACGLQVTHYRLSDGIFRLHKKHVFTRELLDI